MLRVSLRQILAAILVAGMAVLVIVPIVLGIAIQQRTIAPLQLDVSLGGLHLVGYVTHMPDCDRYVTPCQPELMAPPAQDFDFYVIWVLTGTGQQARRMSGSPAYDYSRCHFGINSIDRVMY